MRLGLYMASKPKDAAKDKEADGDEAQEGAEGAAASKSKLKLPSKKILIAAAGLLVIVAGGGGAYFMFFGHKKAEPAVHAVKPPAFVDLPEVLVNLSSAGSDRTQYLKVKIVLELSDQALMQQIQPVMPRLMDTAIVSTG